MKTVKVAVFPAGSEIGLEICNALRYDKYIELVGLTSVSDHSEMVCRKIEPVPYYKEPDFVRKLNEVIDREQIDYLYPGHDDVLLFLTRRQDEIHADVITSGRETVEITRSKKKTYAFFSQEAFIPKVYERPEKVKEYPVFAKPDIGQGSQGTQKIRGPKDWMKIENPQAMVITEYLPGEEVTVDCFTGADGTLQAFVARRRERIKSGIAVRSERIPTTPEIAEIAHRLNQSLDFKGAWFFQLKKSASGRYKLLEAAARIAGTMGLSRNLGINFPLLTLYLHRGVAVEVMENSCGALVERALISRYKLSLTYRTVYVDLDDTLIFKGEVNTCLIGYLYQCVNQKKHLVLLSRHTGDMAEYLKQFRIPAGLFDQLIFVGEEPKSAYITEKEAILIDDSHRERSDVMRRCQIPVFGPENVESLIDWR